MYSSSQCPTSSWAGTSTTQTFSLGFGVAVGTAVGAAVGAAVGLAVGAAVGAAVGFAVGTAVGLAVLPEGLLLEVLELLGFAVAAGFGVAVAEGFTAVLLSFLLSGFGAAVGLAVAAAPAEGAAVGFADALGLALLAAVELVLETGLLLASDVLLSALFSDAVLLTALDAELSTPVSAVLLPAHAAMVSINAAVIKIAVIFFFI